MIKTDFLTKKAYGQLKLMGAKRLLATRKLSLLLLMAAVSTAARAQDATAALEEAADTISSYYDPVVAVVYSIAAIIALIGAVRVYMKWTSGDQNVMGAAAGWFGSAIFLVIAISIAQSFFA